MSPLPNVKGSSFNQPNHDAYNKQIHHFLREVTTTTTTDIPDQVTEILNEMETTTSTTDESLTTQETTSAIEQIVTSLTTTTATSSTPIEIFEEEETISSTLPDYTSLTDALEQDSGTESESSQTILIVLGVLLAILVIVCCVLACIFAKMRRKGFCTVEGKNQATCDEDCQEDVMSLQQSPKESMASAGKSETSRSSDKLLSK